MDTLPRLYDLEILQVTVSLSGIRSDRFSGMENEKASPRELGEASFALSCG
jgi:hypothetical protein